VTGCFSSLPVEIPPATQATTVEECDFDRQFLFDQFLFVAISNRYGLKKV
jgi:hypothetical protein